MALWTLTCAGSGGHGLEMGCYPLRTVRGGSRHDPPGISFLVVVVLVIPHYQHSTCRALGPLLVPHCGDP